MARAWKVDDAWSHAAEVAHGGDVRPRDRTKVLPQVLLIKKDSAC